MVDVVPLLLQSDDLRFLRFVVLVQIVDVLGQGYQVAVEGGVLLLGLYEGVGDLLQAVQAGH